MANWELPQAYQETGGTVEDFAKDIYTQMEAEGKTAIQVLNELDITDQRLRNRVLAGAPRGAPPISEMPRTTSYRVGGTGVGERQTTTPLGTTTQPTEYGEKTPTGRYLGAGPTEAGQVGLPSPVQEGPVMGAGIKMPYVPGAGRMREAMGGVTEKIGEGREMRRGMKEGIVESAQEKQKFYEEAAEWEKTRARQEADVYRTRREQYEGLVKEQADKETKRRDYVQQEIGKIQDAVSEMQTAKIDPARFYKHPDGSANYPKSIAAAIAVGLGALGSALPAQYGGTGGPNVALQIIDKAIDRDIAAQRDDIVNKRAGIGLQMNVLSKMQELYDSDRKQEVGARIIMKETALMKLDEIAYGSPDQRVQLKYNELRMNLQDSIRKDFNTLNIESYKEELGEKEKQVGWEATATQLGQQAARMKQAQALTRQKMLATKGGKQLPASAVAKMSDFRGANKIVANVRQAWKAEMEGNWAAGITQYAPWATDAKSFDDMIRMAAQIVGKKFEGRMTDEDYARFLKMMPSAGDSTKRAMAKLDNMIMFLNAMESETVRTYAETGFDVSGFTRGGGQSKPVSGGGAVE